jgi:hypothetical protein
VLGGPLRFSRCVQLAAEFGDPEEGERPPLEAGTGQPSVSVI